MSLHKIMYEAKQKTNLDQDYSLAMNQLQQKQKLREDQKNQYY